MDFLKNVADHNMTVEIDQGVIRSLVFKAPNTSNMYFRINTWPGHLCFSGDMGTFVFARLTDMFEFFRGEGVNLGYWAEKVEAEDKRGGVTEYSRDNMRSALLSYIEDHDDKAALMEEMECHLETEQEAIQAAYDNEAWGPDFVCDIGHSCRKYTFRFEWCCRAIVWAIDQYDEAKKQAA